MEAIFGGVYAYSKSQTVPNFSPAVGYVQSPRAGPEPRCVFVQVNGFPPLDGCEP